MRHSQTAAIDLIRRWPALGLSVGLALAGVAAVLWLAAPRPAGAAGTVGNGSPASCNEANLRAALNGGGLVTFNCGPGTVTITLAAQLEITQPTTVDGGGKIVLSGGEVTRVFSVGVGASLHVMNLTLYFGEAETGGAIHNRGVLSATNVLFAENAAVYGAAIFNDVFGRVYVSGSRFKDNTATNAGTVASGFGLVLPAAGPAEVTGNPGGDNTPVIIDSSHFEGNTAILQGGALLQNLSALTVTNSVFQNNRATQGSAIAASASRVTILGSVFVSNTAGVMAGTGASPSDAQGSPLVGGGAVHFVGSTALSIAGSDFIRNTTFGGNGAALAVVEVMDGHVPIDAPQPMIVDSRFFENVADGGDGGAIFHEPPLIIDHAEFAENKAIEAASSASGAGPLGVAIGMGGAIASRGPLTVTASAFYSNTSHFDGGAVYSVAPLYIAQSTLVNNTAETDGGGIAARDALTLLDSTVAWNTANNGGGLDLATDDGAQIERSLIWANRASTFGGGVASTDLVVLRNTTVTSNTAQLTGGGIVVAAGEITLTNSTVVSNVAVLGNSGNIHTQWLVAGTAAPQGQPPVYVNNTLIAFGRAAGSLNNCLYPLIDTGHNLESGNDCGLTAGTSLTNTNPLITPLVYRGGPTRVHDLMDGSPAIDAGDAATCPEVDQRGAARPVDGDGVGGAACDIGAVEAKSLLPWLYMPFVAKD